jgi:hypothetical protein
MAAHTGQPTRSRRFIKVYLITWAMLAIGAVAYLAVLAFPQQASAPQVADVDPAKNAPAAAKALAEVRGSISDIRKDVVQLQDAVDERVANEKVVQSRLTALEERVAVIDPVEPQSVQEPSAELPGKSAQKTLEPHTTADILAKTEDDAGAPPKANTLPAAPIETGSIASKAPVVPKEPAAPEASVAPKASKADIVFGEAIVTPAVQIDFAVQLAAGPSLQVLRKSWGQLVARHGGSLATLKPRVIAPRTEGGIYRLLAGPVPTKADADRICAQLRVGPTSCFATAYAGAPL